MKVIEKTGGPVFNQNQFEKISRRVYDLCGIKLTSGKEELVKSRLAKRLQVLKLQGFDEYLRFIEKDATGKELAQMIDVLTTNKTSFFREEAHFDFLRQRIFPSLDRRERRLRIWSAACSSGEEPYTIAMLLRESMPDIDHWNARILATDLSHRVLATARAAVYKKEIVDGIPPKFLSKYFTALPNQNEWRVNDEVRRLVSFGNLNLMNKWPMRGLFDVIFCRNVMIYFDKPTQQNLVNRFAQLLRPGGHLFVGHAESLTGSAGTLSYVQPAVYVKAQATL